MDELIKVLKQKNPAADVTLVALGFDFAKKAHAGQKRLTGESYITHSLAVAQTLATWGLDVDTVTAGLLHDVPEDTNFSIEDVKKEFGKEIAVLVDGITKLGKLKYRGVDRFAESLRKMFVAMAEDIRVIFIKFADRRHNLLTLGALPPVKQQRIAKETLEIYAPIAARLGMGQLKGELEDLAFPYAFPESYHWLKSLLRDQKSERLKDIQKMMKELDKLLKTESRGPFQLDWRVKHNYSLYQKLIKPQYDKDIDRIYDLVAVRVIVTDISRCYQALGLIHQHWKPLPEKFKDYIAQPKPNGYQSLHTVIFTDQGHPLEVQIRTKAMHQVAEYGVAAHWYYSASGKPQQTPRIKKQYTDWLKQLRQIQTEIKNQSALLETLKLDAFSHRIFVFTPHGDVIELPENATPIDFAYHIHTELGNFCGGAKINDKLKELNTPLQSGDVVEIIVDKKRSGPAADWVKIVKTHTARSKIKTALRRQRLGLLGRLLKKD
jgi:GTP diphosphokinase / guanosine-3',5'-bis(diphosphate) 3'-diphosphatase